MSTLATVGGRSGGTLHSEQQGTVQLGPSSLLFRTLRTQITQRTRKERTNTNCFQQGADLKVLFEFSRVVPQEIVTVAISAFCQNAFAMLGESAPQSIVQHPLSVFDLFPTSAQVMVHNHQIFRVVGIGQRDSVLWCTSVKETFNHGIQQCPQVFLQGFAKSKSESKEPTDNTVMCYVGNSMAIAHATKSEPVTRDMDVVWR